MYEYYHHYFMDFYEKEHEPNKTDVLTGAIPGVTKRMKVQFQKTIKDKVKYYDFINPEFEWTSDELKYTDKVTHR